MDNHYLKFHTDKAKRITERGSKCSYTDPVAFDGAIELLEEFCSYLPERYPSLYKKTPVGMDNLLTGESFNIVERPLIEDPMQMAARMTQDDLAIMFEKEDGQYYLLAGSILLAGFWKLEDKLGMPLSEIHTSGNVPGYKTKLEKGMMNFFRRVQPNGPVQRVSCSPVMFETSGYIVYQDLARGKKMEHAQLTDTCLTNRTTTSSKSTPPSPGPLASAMKTALKAQSAGSPPKRTKPYPTTTFAPRGNHSVVYPAAVVLCSLSARISTLSLRSVKSHMYRVDLRAR